MLGTTVLLSAWITRLIIIIMRIPLNPLIDINNTCTASQWKKSLSPTTMNFVAVQTTTATSGK